MSGFVACIRVDERPELVLSDARVDKCQKCGAPVWVHPDTLRHFEGKLPPCECWPCMLERPLEELMFVFPMEPDGLHVLRAGRAVCGAGPPSRWPSGQRWVRESELDKMGNGDCILCYELVKRGR